MASIPALGLTEDGRTVRIALNVRSPPKQTRPPPTPEEIEREKEMMENAEGPVLGAWWPHAKSGTLHSCVIKGDYRLYFQRFLRKEDRQGRPFLWSFFIAKHPGEAIKDYKTLSDHVIISPEWKKRKIVVKTLAPTGNKWIQGVSSYVGGRTTMRVSMKEEQVECEFVFPPSPDEQAGIPVIPLAYTGEDADSA